MAVPTVRVHALRVYRVEALSSDFVLSEALGVPVTRRG